MILTLALGCAPDLRDRAGPDDTTETSSAETDVPDDGTASATLDATGQEAWVYFDIERGAVAEPATPTDSTEWDLAFQRFRVAINGGISGTGAVEAVAIDGMPLDGLTTPPAEGWVTDQADADEDGEPEYALGDWYDYDSSTHVLAPKDRIYAVRSVEGAVFGVEVHSYYDEAGTPGFMTFRWRALGTP